MTTSLEPERSAQPEYPAPRAQGCPFDPSPRIRELQEQASITRTSLWDGSTPWLVTRHEDFRALLADPRVSADPTRAGYPSTTPAMLARRTQARSFISMDDPDHARLRRMVTAPFAIKRIEAMRSAIQRIVDGLLNDLLAGPKPVDLVQAFALPMPSLVICELLGVPYEDHGFFQQNSRLLVKRDTPTEDALAAQQRLVDYIDDLLGRKLTDPGDDLLTDLATQRVRAGELTRREAAAMGMLLLVAGHETTANMIALGTVALLEHPDQLTLLRETEDPKLVAGAVEELLRYLTIVHMGRRRVALADIEYGGVTIRAGEGIVFAGEVGNRDPEVFADPDRLDITRDARRHVAFGFGVHQCLGQPLARVELQVAYASLFRRIPTLSLATSVDELPFKHDGQVYGVYELPVTW
ncbi:MULTISPECIES: cytochrome P450 [Amycolatopsis]|uniref:Cytochrome P450 n=1 Tax=Amycolatopsis bullii TaxID=941987 RepID=A0ABQ3JWZ4_9PSEU|nr:cytochrome P450 [Amycolatopsis bullii]GHF93897.1 cytochrome P450 [Amycolatopsis bullii]